MISCPICIPVVKGILNYFVSLKFLFSKDFIKENYYKHFGYSVLISFFLILFLREFCYLNTTPLLFNLFIGGFTLFIINGVRESKLEDKYGAPFSWNDIFFGAHGGVLGAYLCTLIF